MKRLLMVAVMLIVTAASAWGQGQGPADGAKFNGQLGSGEPIKTMDDTDSTAWYLRSSKGIVKITQPINWRSETTPICTSTLAPQGAPDSSSCIDISAYKYPYLILSSSAGNVRYAIQVRYCLNGLQDSTDVSPILGRKFDYADSVAALGVQAAYGAPSVLGDTEFMIYVAPSTALTGPSQAKNRYIPLTISGEPIRVKTISVRWRILSGNAASIAAKLYLGAVDR